MHTYMHHCTKVNCAPSVLQHGRRCDHFVTLDKEAQDHCTSICVQFHRERANHQSVAAVHSTHVLAQ